VALGCGALLGCGAPPVTDRFPDRAALEPRPGTERLVVASRGAPLGVHPPKVGADRLCLTPCTLHLEPGPIAMYVDGEGFGKTIAVDVPRGGAQVDVRLGSKTAGNVGVAMATIGAVVLTAGLFAIPGTGDPKARPFVYGALGGGAALLGAGAFVVLYWGQDHVSIGAPR
jgi:hypothetical protein